MEQLRKSLIKSKNQVGDQTEHRIAPELIDKEVAPSTTVAIEVLEKKLHINIEVFERKHMYAKRKRKSTEP